MTHPQPLYEAVLGLVEMGLNDCQIARFTGIPRQTIRNWRMGIRTGKHYEGGGGGCARCEGRLLSKPWYAYLLGMYLGDGCLARCPRKVYRLDIALDIRYPNVIDECAFAITRMRPEGQGRVNFVPRLGCTVVYSYRKHWPCLFPQHGAGRKHLRSIPS